MYKRNRQCQDLLRNYDLSTVKVDKLSDAEILRFKQQLNDSGLTQAQAEQLAISKGMPIAEVQKLRLRLQQVGITNQGQQYNRQLDNRNNVIQQDTSDDQYPDTVTRKPLINPRIFGSELFNNPTLNFQPNIPVATPMNYVIGPGDQLNINVYGVQETSIPLSVTPEGNIVIPNVGQAQVAGLTIEDAIQSVGSLMGRTAYSTLRSGSSKLSINVGQIKSISVTIIGSNMPGNYTVPSLATAFNALFVAGGPAEFGTGTQSPGCPVSCGFSTPYTYRCPAGHPDPCPVCTGAPHLEEILQYEGPENVAAVIMETITGTNGVIPPPPGYLQAVREVCDRHGILLILDEVMAGFGRTGKWFACEHWDVVPDIITLAKGINSGYVPLGAMTISEKLADWVRDKYFAGGLTYSGHPLACAAGVASIEAFREEGIVENSAELGEVLGDRLAELADKHETIGEVRGLGLFYGIELVKDRATREPLVPFNASGESFAPMAKIARAALDRGLYLMTHWNVIIVAPPLTITREELDEGLTTLDEALTNS